MLTLSSASNFSLTDLAELVNRAFKGYIGGEVHFSEALMASMLVSAGVDLALSQVASFDDEPVAVALISRRATAYRLALMGVAGGSQERGFGSQFMNELIDQARAAGVQTYELEVIIGNLRGERLYKRCGFQIVQRLASFKSSEGTVAVQGDPSRLEHVPLMDVARLMVANADADSPWQVDGWGLPHAHPIAGLSVRYRDDDGDAYIAAGLTDATPIPIRALVVTGKRRAGLATRAVASLMATYPGKQWGVPAICPEKYAPIFNACGMTEGAIAQFQMRLAL
ncbi:MAG: GNAT family N-acetyltransferase [Chloroflexi bacterium]|nr:GNAT family N-acetyltransferase [Chloroflexota bacterium]